MISDTASQTTALSVPGPVQGNAPDRPAIEEQGVAAGEIGSNSQQAALGAQELSSNVAGVNQATTETGAAASQVLQSARGLSDLAENLRGEVDKFLEILSAA